MKQSRILAALLCLVLVVGLLPLASAPARAEISGVWEYIVESGGATITKYNGSGGIVEIPSKLGGHSVKRIGDYSFENCVSLTSVKIPSGVISIGRYAFCGCAGLTGVTIPNSVTSIGDSAFQDCAGLTGVTIPGSVTSIGISAFQSCAGLTGVTIPNSAASVGEYAFSDCTSLKSVKLGNGLTVIGYGAFSGCSALTGVAIPDSVTDLGVYAFSDCTSLKTVIIGSGVIAIPYGVFSGCAKLTDLTIPSSVTYINGSAFADCARLMDVTIPDRVNAIDISAFANCSSLTAIVIPDSVSVIESSAFAGCQKLATVTIGKAVSRIGEQAFSNCTALKTVNYTGTAAQWSKIEIGTGNAPLTGASRLTGWPSPPFSAEITVGNNLTTGRVKLSWNVVSGATGYNIYRSTSVNGTYEKLNESPVTDLTYTDGRSGNAGNTYWYRITTVKSSRESAKSTAVSGLSRCQRPAGLKATANADGSVTLKWDAPLVKGSVSGYRVYLWNTSKGAFQWIDGSLKAAGTATTVKIPASSLTAYKGKTVKFSLRGFNTKNTLGTLSIYAAPASAMVK